MNAPSFPHDLQPWLTLARPDPWLLAMLEAASSDGSLWAAACAAGNTVRLRQHSRAERRAFSDALMTGRLPPDLDLLGRWAQTRTEAQVHALSSQAVTQARATYQALVVLLRLPATHSAPWRAHLQDLAITRDDLAAVLSILRARAAEAPLVAALQPLDAFGASPQSRRIIRQGLGTTSSIPPCIRLRRVADLDPTAWWAPA